MIWIKNLESISEKEECGTCPICGSEDTEYTFTGEIGHIGSCDLWCNHCKCAYHVSRMQIVKGHPLNKVVPNDLIYK